MLFRKTNIALVSSVGGMETQEDNFFFPPAATLTEKMRKQTEKTRRSVLLHGWHGETFLVAVCDGMGGHIAGEVASALIAEYLRSHVRELYAWPEPDEKTVSSFLADLNRYFCEWIQSNPAYRTMGSTLCGLFFHGDRSFGFYAGDSRIYRYRDGHLIQLSEDQTEGQMLLRRNLLSPAEEKNYPARKRIYHYIGRENGFGPTVRELERVSPGAQYLLCSDGLTDVLPDEKISEILGENRNLTQKCRRLVQCAEDIAETPSDNITAVLISF